MKSAGQSCIWNRIWNRIWSTLPKIRFDPADAGSGWVSYSPPPGMLPHLPTLSHTHTHVIRLTSIDPDCHLVGKKSGQAGRNGRRTPYPQGQSALNSLPKVEPDADPSKGMAPVALAAVEVDGIGVAPASAGEEQPRRGPSLCAADYFSCLACVVDLKPSAELDVVVPSSTRPRAEPAKRAADTESEVSVEL